MNPLDPARRAFLGAMAGAALAATGAGCRLRSAALPRRTFLLQEPPVGDRPVGGGAGVLLVRPLRVASAFDSRAFVIRRGDSEYTADAYHAFLLSPGAMIAEALANWVRARGVFATVITGGSQVAPTHALEGELLELYGDYRNPARPLAVLGGQFRMLHPLNSPAARPLWQREVRREIQIPKAGPDELVQGWNQALAEVLRGLEPDLSPRLPDRNLPQA